MENSDLPSQTALTAAAARAAHLIVDGVPVIFADGLAAALLGERAEEFISYHRAHGTHPVLSCARAQVLCRSRSAEDQLATCVRHGVTQYVILGAGLDSFAYRTGPVGPARPALVSWLGVTMYLTQAAISRTLAEIGGFAPGTQLITDYMLPAVLHDETGNTYVELVAPAAAERGEPWLSFFAPGGMSALLERHGFGRIEHVQQRDSIPAVLWDRTDSLRPTVLSVLARATVTRLQSGHA